MPLDTPPRARWTEMLASLAVKALILPNRRRMNSKSYISSAFSSRGNEMKKPEGEVTIVTGGRICGLPSTPERVYRALHGKGESLHLEMPGKAA